ncbi:MAG: signal recognition particle-docking protein FtsY [Bacilli bacterium]|nr:signal recognition particle-docking protein FtsY [Bacilli bacterium]
MGLISFLKNKFAKKEEKEVEAYSQGMEKSREFFSNKLTNLSKKYKKVNQEYFEQLEEILIESDVGVNLTLKVIDELLIESREKKINDAEEINSLLIDLLFEDYSKKGSSITDISFDNQTTVLLVVGVNGVGKTTTIAKIANRYLKQGKSVALVAGDTFRAGAIEQLCIWGDRLNIPVIKGNENADPASVVYDGVKYAKNNNIDLLIVDTAGRLQNKQNLMDELSKIKRVISKEIANGPQETFLIIDATTGQNGVVQAKAFSEITPLTGVVITKMDGTSKGGIILAIRDELGTPVRFIGLGEKMEDLKPFDLDKYLYGLCIGE